MGIGCQAIAQKQDDVQFEEIDTILNKVILKKELMGGAMLNFRGWGFVFRKGFNENAFKKNLWEIELFGIKGDKQVRVSRSSYNSNAQSFVFGKLNKVYDLRTGLGRQHRLNTKPYWGGVEVRFTYYGGLSLGIAKPIYLYVFTDLSYLNVESEKYDPEKHFAENIYGRAPFLDGIDETKFHPGAYAKIGLNFEFGQYKTSIKALEVGLTFDAYATPIPIMAYSNKHQYFFNGYVCFTFGKRYNKY